MIKRWDPQAVKDMGVARLMERGETVGVFVESEARRRLDAIKRPDNRRAVAYRRFLSRHILTHTVARTPNAVVIRVGMKKRSEKGGDHHGFYIEVGSATAPAHPYLRPAVFQNAAEIVALLGG